MKWFAISIYILVIIGLAELYMHRRLPFLLPELDHPCGAECD
jgi:hypothetical protein